MSFAPRPDLSMVAVAGLDAAEVAEAHAEYLRAMARLDWTHGPEADPILDRYRARLRAVGAAGARSA